MLTCDGELQAKKWADEHIRLCQIFSAIGAGRAARQFNQYRGPRSHRPPGVKGVGEPAMVPTIPPITNAMYDAVGVRVTDLPATPPQ